MIELDHYDQIHLEEMGIHPVVALEMGKLLHSPSGETISPLIWWERPIGIKVAYEISKHFHRIFSLFPEYDLLELSQGFYHRTTLAAMLEFMSEDNIRMVDTNSYMFYLQKGNQYAKENCRRR